MMEYFNAEEVDALSLQDMIDCDIKTDIDNLLQIQNSDKMSSLEYCLQQINSCDVGNIHNNNNLEYVPLSLDIPMDNKHSWGTSEAERLHQLVEVENTDPNLLVNPQTGVPIHHEQMESDSQATVLSVPRLSMNSQTPTVVGLISASPPQFITETTLPSMTTTANNSPLRLSSANSGHSITFSQSSQAGQVRENGNIHGELALASPSRTNPVLLEQLQNPIGLHSPRKLQCVTNTHLATFCRANGNLSAKRTVDSDAERVYAKPAYSYSCLIAMALKNSKTGSLPVSEIYHFMTSNFPYFKTAPDGWKNSVRHNLSLNKCFEKVENPNNTGNTRKGCLWGLNPAKVEKMEEEIVKWRKKDPESVKNSLANPEKLELIESGRAGSPPSLSHRPASQASDLSITEVSSDPCAQLLLSSDDGLSKPKSVSDMLSVEMTGLDSSLTLDPVLSELASQSGLWDDDLTGDLKLDVPFSSSPLTTCNSPLMTQPSPLSGLTSCDSTIQGSYVYTTAPFLIEQSPMSKPITIYTQTPSRTLSAQT